MLIFGFLAFSLSAVLWLFASSRPAVQEFILTTRGETSYLRGIASHHDLDELYGHYTRIFGDENIPKEDFSRWMKRNPYICYKVFRVTAHSHKERRILVGFFDFEPLTKAAIKRLIANPDETLHIDISDILPPRYSPSTYYVGSIGATSESRSARFGTLMCAINFIEEKSAGQELVLYARPVTKDGKRICKSFGFAPIGNSPKSVWKRVVMKGEQLPKYNHIIQQLNAHK